MADHPKDGGPAFPQFDDTDRRDRGMSLRAYAAIQLRQPDSGIDWLDDMIRNARRDDLAGRALNGILACPNGPTATMEMPDAVGRVTYISADAVLAAREGEE